MFLNFVIPCRTEIKTYVLLIFNIRFSKDNQIIVIMYINLSANNHVRG